MRLTPFESSKGNNNRVQVKTAWKINPKCKVCGCLTSLQRSGNVEVYEGTATYGHLYSVWDIRRGLAPEAWQIECYRCNHDKEREENPTRLYNNLYGGTNYKRREDQFPELLISLAETPDNEIYLTQIEFKRDT